MTNPRILKEQVHFKVNKNLLKLLQKSNTNKTCRKSSRSKKEEIRKQKSNEKRRNHQVQILLKKIREVERRRIEDQEQKIVLVSNQQEYNVLEIATHKEEVTKVILNIMFLTEIIQIIQQIIKEKSYSDNRTSYNDHRKSVQLSSPLYSRLIMYTMQHLKILHIQIKKIQKLKNKRERETEYI